MRVHAIETGRVRIKANQIIGRGHGLRRRLAPLFDAEWSDWLPVNAYAIERPDGAILVDTARRLISSGCRAGIPTFAQASFSTSIQSRRLARD